MKKNEKTIIQDGQETIELIGADKEAFEVDRKQMQDEAALLEAEYKAKQEARNNAIKKLAEVAGLSEAEINAIL